MSKKRPGRPAHEPTEKTRAQVKMLCAYGLKQDAIAAIIGVCDVTLRKHYEHELAVGLAEVTAQVANSLVKKALSDRPDAVNAAKFFLQSQAGWMERNEVTNVVRDITDEPLSEEEWAARYVTAH